MNIVSKSATYAVIFPLDQIDQEGMKSHISNKKSISIVMKAHKAIASRGNFNCNGQ